MLAFALMCCFEHTNSLLALSGSDGPNLIQTCASLGEVARWAMHVISCLTLKRHHSRPHFLIHPDCHSAELSSQQEAPLLGQPCSRRGGSGAGGGGGLLLYISCWEEQCGGASRLMQADGFRKRVITCAGPQPTGLTPSSASRGREATPGQGGCHRKGQPRWDSP